MSDDRAQVSLLLQADANIDGLCWDTTPLMAALSAGHISAARLLLELKANPNIQNGASMTALDYARDEESAAMALGFMRAPLWDESVGVRARSRLRPTSMGGNGMAETPSGTFGSPSMHCWHGASMTLEEALEVLGAPSEWLEPLRANGTHYADIRRLWRARILASHPDKQQHHPSRRRGMDVQARRDRDGACHDEATLLFRATMAAFDIVEACYAARQR